METYWLRFELLSDATFGRGEGLAGVVDQEVAHDDDGLPYLRGRTLKGLLNEECANILYALSLQTSSIDRWQQAAHRLWGGPGSTRDDDACLRVGDAQLPEDLRRAVRRALFVPHSKLKPADILESLTAIRRQTAVDEVTGVPDEGTLRAMRVVVRGTIFEAPLIFLDNARPDDMALLAACVLAWRRAGTGRNRGRGKLEAKLHADQAGQPGDEITPQWFKHFGQEVLA